MPRRSLAEYNNLSSNSLHERCDGRGEEVFTAIGDDEVRNAQTFRSIERIQTERDTVCTLFLSNDGVEPERDGLVEGEAKRLVS